MRVWDLGNRRALIAQLSQTATIPKSAPLRCRYSLTSWIASGAYGTVCKGEDKQTAMPVAIKVRRMVSISARARLSASVPVQKMEGVFADTPITTIRCLYVSLPGLLSEPFRLRWLLSPNCDGLLDGRSEDDACATSALGPLAPDT
jgi:hypothetical protein